MLAREGVLIEVEQPLPAVIRVAAVEPVAFFLAGFGGEAEVAEARARVGELLAEGEARLQTRRKIGEVHGVAQRRADGAEAREFAARGDLREREAARENRGGEQAGEERERAVGDNEIRVEADQAGGDEAREDEQAGAGEAILKRVFESVVAAVVRVEVPLKGGAGFCG